MDEQELAGCFVVIVLFGVIALVLWMLRDNDVPSSPPVNSLTPDDLMDFVENYRRVRSDWSKTEVQRDREIESLWKHLSGKKFRWAGSVVDVSKRPGDYVSVAVGCDLERWREKKSSIVISVAYPMSALSALERYKRWQAVWVEGYIPADDMREVLELEQRAISLPGSVKPKT